LIVIAQAVAPVIAGRSLRRVAAFVKRGSALLIALALPAFLLLSARLARVIRADVAIPDRFLQAQISQAVTILSLLLMPLPALAGPRGRAGVGRDSAQDK